MEVFEIPYDCSDDIPDEELLKLHRKYWEFIAEKSLNYKPEIISIKKRRPVIVCGGCFLCEYAARKADMVDPDDKTDVCSMCQIVCPARKELEKNWSCLCLGGLFRKWYLENDPRQQKEYALQIANLELIPCDITINSDSEIKENSI